MLYEIWSLGHKPFETVTNAEVSVYTVTVHDVCKHVCMCVHTLICMSTLIKALKKIDSGYRLPPPPGCPRTIYRAMIKCWYAT